MHRFTIRHMVAAGALALIAAVPMAACGADPVSPLPVQAAEAEPTATTAPTGTVPTRTTAATTAPTASRTRPAVRPTKTKTVRPTSTRPTTSCFGAVRHDVDLQNTVLDLIRSMCFRTGGVLRLQGIGPGLVTATPESLVSQSYEGGVVDLRFVRPGTVTVRIPQDEKTYTITVVVIR
jgi:hypothetical protein